MKKNKKVTVTQEYINKIKKERDSYKEQRDQYLNDLNKHRAYWVRLYRNITTNLGGGHSTNSSWILESMAKHFNSVNGWYW